MTKARDSLVRAETRQVPSQPDLHHQRPLALKRLAVGMECLEDFEKILRVDKPGSSYPLCWRRNRWDFLFAFALYVSGSFISISSFRHHIQTASIHAGKGFALLFPWTSSMRAWFAECRQNDIWRNRTGSVPNSSNTVFSSRTDLATAEKNILAKQKFVGLFS